MIPANANAPYMALCYVQSEVDPSETVRLDYPVVAWDDDGYPLVVHRSTLVPASTIPGFEKVQEHAVLSTVIPGGGWRGKVRNDNGRDWSSPVIAWHVRHYEGGHPIMLPVVADPEGRTGYLKDFTGEWSLDHPDATGD